MNIIRYFRLVSV